MVHLGRATFAGASCLLGRFASRIIGAGSPLKWWGRAVMTLLLRQGGAGIDPTIPETWPPGGRPTEVRSDRTSWRPAETITKVGSGEEPLDLSNSLSRP